MQGEYDCSCGLGTAVGEECKWRVQELQVWTLVYNLHQFKVNFQLYLMKYHKCVLGNPKIKKFTKVPRKMNTNKCFQSFFTCKNHKKHQTIKTIKLTTNWHLYLRGPGGPRPKIVFNASFEEGREGYQMLLTGSKNIVPSLNYRDFKMQEKIDFEVQNLRF